MYYFDNEFLKQYLQLDNDLKIVYNGAVYSLPSESDVENSKFGLCYDENGKLIKIDYRRISGIYINDSFMDLKGLEEYINSQNQVDGEETTKEEPKETSKPKEEPSEETPEDETKKEPKIENENVDIYLIGAQILNEYNDRRNKRNRL